MSYTGNLCPTHPNTKCWSPHDQLALQQVLQTAPDGIKWTTVASAAGASHGFNPPISMQWLRVRLGC